MPQVVITEFMDPGAVDSLSSDYEILYDQDLWSARLRLQSVLDDARALIVRNKTVVDSELLGAAPHLSIVARLGVGLDNIDLASCEDRQIVVTPALGANAAAVAEYVISATLHLLRDVFSLNSAILSGGWPREESKGSEAMGRQLGLVGLGDIAQQVGNRARALGMEVAAYDPYVEDSSSSWSGVTKLGLEALAATSDVMSVHVPLVEETRYLVDADLIARMKPGSVLINTSRGGVVEERAVANALRSGLLGGAALDVFEEEPLGLESRQAFEDAPNLILTPHVAGITEESDLRIGEMTVASVREVLGA